MNRRIITLAIIVSLISVTLTSITFAQIPPGGGGVGATEEYKSVTIGETFYVSATATSPYVWKLKSYDANYLSAGPIGVACGVPINESVVNCTYSFSFKALKVGETTIGLNKINTTDNSTVEIRYIYVTIEPLITHEYKEVTVDGTFTISVSSKTPDEWKLKSYDKNYLDHRIGGVGCTPDGSCTYSFQFTALKEGETTIELNKINTSNNSTSEIKYVHVTINPKGKPDLTIEKIDYYLDNPTNPTKLHFQVLIKNIGTASCSFDSNIRISQLSNYQANKCTYLNLGESCVETGYGYSGLGGTIPPGYYDIIASVDPRNLVDELNEDNNQAERRIYIPSIISEEYKTVSVGEIFTVSATATSPYVWKLKSYDKTYLEALGETVACAVTPDGYGTCNYNFQFKAKIAGKTIIELNRIDTSNNNIIEIRYIYVTIIPSIIKIVHLNEPFGLIEGNRAEVVDYKNMMIILDGVGITAISEEGGVIPPYSREFVILVIKMPTGVTTRLVIDEGESKEVFGAIIKVLDIDFNARTARFLVTLEGAEFELRVKTDRYMYSPGDIVKIMITLSGDPSLDFSNVLLEIHILSPVAPSIPLEVKKVGPVVSECTQAETTGGYTCPVINEYSFIAKYSLPLDAPIGVYSVDVKAKLGNIAKWASIRFEVRKIYSDYVDVSIKPKEQHTIIGRPVTYDVTITDKHPVPIIPTIVTETNITSPYYRPIYNYMISLYGLPYYSTYPYMVSIQAGSSKTFELKVFPSPTKTAVGIVTAVEKVKTVPVVTETAEERVVSVPATGGAITQPESVEPIIAAEEEVPEEPVEAMFRFTVQATLKENLNVRDSDSAVLYVRYIPIPHPPPFPEPERIDIEIHKGWNLISLPGIGSGFSRGTCSAVQKPIAFVYISDRGYVSIEDAARIMGIRKLLEYLSTHSFWVYSYEDCKITFYTNSYATYSGLSLDQGWNLLGITKDMVGETLSNIKGTCTFERIYTWDADLQEWVEKSENDLIERMGYGIVVKTSSACKFKENMLQPPPFPEE